jgi:hypothetical protein
MATYYQLPTGKTLKINNILDFTDDDYEKAIAFDKGEYINNPFMSKVKEDNKIVEDGEIEENNSEIDDILREYNIPPLENIEEIDISDEI